MERTLIKDTLAKVGEKVLLKGWVAARRDHGKLLFLDVKDFTGIIQVVVANALVSENIGDWFVLEIEGTVKERPEKLRNPKLLTGSMEIEAERVTVINKADTPPIPLEGDGYEIGEELRLQYRYLDLRRDRLITRLKTRAQLMEIVRHFFQRHGFTEIETPQLTKSTPEGARDFLVPSRLEPGTFYALPQSPQQYKQLLMLSTIERYFQFPRCFRDEDLRGDRMLEFTQLDVEMAFTFQEEVLHLTEQLVIEATELLGKRIQEKPFPRMTFADSMARYGNDKPDLRKDKTDPDLMAYVWITDFPMFEEKDDGSLGATHHPFTAIEEGKRGTASSATPREEILSLKAQQYDLALNGFEVFGGSIREHNPANVMKTFEILGYSKERIERDFGHLLKAFSYGVPPHGGIASGFDRWLQALTGERSIREVVPFPTSGSGKTAVMDSPSAVEEEQLEPLGIRVANSKSESRNPKQNRNPNVQNPK